MQIPETEIIVTKGGTELLRKTVRPGDYVIGRDAECEVHVDAEQVAPRHAQLTVNFDHALIEDLGSDSGTRVNGKPVKEPTRLWPNQKIQIGAATVELRRVKSVLPPDVSLAPQSAAVKRLLPEEFLRDKKYDIGGVIAQGGMGAILDAKETVTERTVAMKVMLDGSNPDDLTRFVAEAKVTAQLEHPNIVPVHELSVDENDQIYYTMKFVKGITLKKVLEEMATGNAETLQTYPLPVLLTIFQKVCDAIAFAHSKGVIHRDLKPENIMLGDYGEALVMDWGLAKVLGQREAPAAKEEAMRSMVRSLPPEASGSTLSGTVMGTPQYMSPEQARGEVEALDVRADIYSLGAILYHILALRPSVTGNDAWAMVAKVSDGEVEPLTASKLRPIPDSLAAVVRKAMAFERDKRYQHVSDLQRDIGAYQNGFATSAENAGAWKQFTLLVKRNKAASIGVAAVMLVGSVLGTKAIIEGQRAERGEALARSEAAHAKQEAERAEANARTATANEAKAKATLADLRRTAPVFAAQAKVDFEEGNFDAAIEKIGYAIQLDDSQADYHLFLANLRESSQDLGAAAEGYRRVLALRPADAAAKTNLALCETLLRETGGSPLGNPQQFKLLEALRRQKRLLETAPLAALIDPDVKVAKAAILSRLHEARKLPKWTDSKVSALPDGTFKIDLHFLAAIDFSVLKGQPVSVLDLKDTGIADLSSLAGLPLKDLNLVHAKVTELSPLHGMPLENLELTYVPVTDLSPLRGMPLKKLDLGETPATDLSPLRGMKLKRLNLSRTKVADLSPLAGMPLVFFSCEGCKGVTDLSPLHGAPLVELRVSGTAVASLAPLAGAPLKRLDLGGTKVTDIALLSQFASLEELRLDGLPITDLAPLAKLHLTSLNCVSTKITTIAPLRGQPLRFLHLEKTGVTDLSPLEGCATLEEIILPAKVGDLSVLRQLPRLKLISTPNGSGHVTRSAEEFWKEYDARQAAGK